jgi:hypothetical protein
MEKHSFIPIKRVLPMYYGLESGADDFLNLNPV